jgi:hypothetical protein
LTSTFAIDPVTRGMTVTLSLATQRPISST